LSRLDELEGTSRDHYERLPIRVEPIDRRDAVLGVETYFGHRSYGLKLLFFN
jgi:gamma-glutamylaminecyclotransferase